MTTYYISTIGSDTLGDGTRSSPFATYAHIKSFANPEDRVIFEPGIYDEAIDLGLLGPCIEGSI